MAKATTKKATKKTPKAAVGLKARSQKAKKASPQKASPKKATPKKVAPKKASSKAVTAQVKTTDKTKAATKLASSSSAKVAAPVTGSLLEQINLTLQAAVEQTMELGEMEIGLNGVTENDLQDSIKCLSAVRKKGWDLLMAAFPDFIDRLIISGMIECAYEDEEVGTMRFAGSAIGWDEDGSQFVVVGRRGDVWEGEGELLETIMAGESEGGLVSDVEELMED
jgi:hypothetical protein